MTNESFQTIRVIKKVAGWDFRPGDVVTISAVNALFLIRHGYATEITVKNAKAKNSRNSGTA